MKRANRLEIVRKVISDKEQECAVRLTGAQTRLADAERRAVELRRYLNEYQHSFEQRAKQGIGVNGVRDYQTFIARIGEAVRQQDGLLQQLRAECERIRAQWRHAAARKSGIGKVVAKAHHEARQLEERQQQKELDERALRHRSAR
jgi:flagellar protein FliJ